jgi:signal transduction histidine kinase
MSTLAHVFAAYLRESRDELISRWMQSLLATGFSSLSHTTIQHKLAGSFDQFWTLVQQEPPDLAAAQAIGSTLADMHFLQDETLAVTYQVLGTDLLALVPPHEQAHLSERVMPLLGAIATGWFRQTRLHLLSEQEQVRRALFAERQQVEAELRRSETHLRTVITSAPVVLFAINSNGFLTLSEGRGLTRLPYPTSGTGQSVFENPPHPRVPDYVRRALAGETVLARVPVNDVVFETRYAPLRNGANDVVGVIGVAIDITDQVQAEVELARMRRRLTERVEQEQQRIARELHDDAVQRLVAIGYQITNVVRRADQQANESSQVLQLALALERVRSDILATAETLRGIVGDLRPPGLDELGLSAALTGYVERLRSGSSKQPVIVLDLEPFPAGALPSTTALTLFRCAQEALRNALRHSQAHRITVRLQRNHDALVLYVADDGCGFSVPDTLHTFVQANHFGLAGLAERASGEGGELQLSSQPGQGTVVTITLPT